MVDKDLISKEENTLNVVDERKSLSDNGFDSTSDGADGFSGFLRDDELDSVSGGGCGGTTKVYVPERKRRR